MYVVMTLPYQTPDSKGWASDILDEGTGQRWRTTGPSLRTALLGAKDILDNAPKDNCQHVDNGGELIIPA